jgi:hypothetical protein
MQYYGAFYRTALYPLLQRINTYLVRWLPRVPQFVVTCPREFGG